MPSATGRGFRPGGVLRALGRLVLLIGFGFGAGLLTGVLSQEPELLVGHLRGESEAVPLTMPPPLRGEPEIELATEIDDARPMDRRNEWQSPARSEIPQAKIQRTVTNRPEPESALTTIASDPWAIQVGAFSEQGTAQRLVDMLQAKGYAAELLPAVGKTGRWRVRIQPIANEVEAREIAVKLKRVERLPTWVLLMTGSSGS
ncbi:MAG: SPOR domain-containing protein [Myxococcota bacterium]